MSLCVLQDQDFVSFGPLVRKDKVLGDYVCIQLYSAEMFLMIFFSFKTDLMFAQGMIKDTSSYSFCD